MLRPINAIIAASLLLISGNAMAIIMDNQIYGNSGYSLNDFDVAIKALQEDITSRKDERRYKKALRFDRKVERLIYKIDSAMASGKEKKPRNKTKKLIRKEEKLLVLLADYLPDLNSLLQNDDMFTTGNILFATDFLPPEIFLTQPGLVTAAVSSNRDENTQGSIITISGTASTENRFSCRTLDACIAEPGFCRPDALPMQRERQ